MKVSLYCYNKDGKPYYKVYRKRYEKIEKVGDYIFISLDRYNTVLCREKDIITMIFYP